jgi:precorrin-6A/cobalt-precorrin-6A reductase
MPSKILILGGTGEAAELAKAAHSALQGRVDIVSSLAGRTDTIPDLPGEIRTGGFGGAEGLAFYLAQQNIAAVIDATHPFAARISTHAQQACQMQGVKLLRLERPGWAKMPGDRWIEAADANDAADRLPALGKRAFLTLGAGEIEPFSKVRGVWFLVRLLKTPEKPLPLDACEIVTGKGPFAAEAEAGLMRSHAIDVLVSKASGGRATYGKISAARALGIPVLMIKRPDLPGVPGVRSLREALAWLAETIP